HSRPLIDYITLMDIYQGCANAAPANAGAPLNFLNPNGAGRCASLHAKGLLQSTATVDQATEAQKIINDFGILPEQNLVQPGYWFGSVSGSIAVTYANPYSRASVVGNLCNYSFAVTDPATGHPIAPNGTAALATAEAQLFGTSNGIPPSGIIS